MSGGEYILPRAVAERMKLDARARYPELFGPQGAEPIVVTIRVDDTNRARIDELLEPRGGPMPDAMTMEEAGRNMIAARARMEAAQLAERAAREEAQAAKTALNDAEDAFESATSRFLDGLDLAQAGQ